MKEIDWANLSFGYMKTDYNVRINFRNGAWGEDGRKQEKKSDASDHPFCICRRKCIRH